MHQTLRRMEADGLVLRDVLDGTQPAVLYRLTSIGQSLLEPLTALTRWYHLVQAKDADKR